MSKEVQEMRKNQEFVVKVEKDGRTFCQLPKLVKNAIIVTENNYIPSRLKNISKQVQAIALDIRVKSIKKTLNTRIDSLKEDIASAENEIASAKSSIEKAAKLNVEKAEKEVAKKDCLANQEKLEAAKKALQELENKVKTYSEALERLKNNLVECENNLALIATAKCKKPTDCKTYEKAIRPYVVVFFEESFDTIEKMTTGLWQNVKAYNRDYNHKNTDSTGNDLKWEQPQIDSYMTVYKGMQDIGNRFLKNVKGENDVLEMPLLAGFQFKPSHKNVKNLIGIFARREQYTGKKAVVSYGKQKDFCKLLVSLVYMTDKEAIEKGIKTVVVPDYLTF